MIDNIEDFIRYIPTARGTHFEDIQPFIEEGVLWSQTEIFGNNLLEYIKISGSDDAKRLLNSIIALKAYSGAIPFLDVVQTQNGFAVVNNSNVVPASRERVDKLLDWVNERMYFHVDMLIELVSASADMMAEWRKFSRFSYLTELLFWTGSEFAGYSGNYESTYRQKRTYPFADLHKMHILIKGFQDEEIASFISADYLQELIDKKRSQMLPADDEKIVKRLKFILGLYIQKNDFKAREHLKEIVNEMMLEPDRFPTYFNSKEYRLKMAARYENKQEDPTYFFM